MWLSKERLLSNSTPRFLTDDEESREQPSSVRQCSRLLLWFLGLIISSKKLFVAELQSVDAHCSPLAHSPETRLFSGEQNDLAPPARAMGSTSLTSRWEPLVLPDSVLNTISQARAPSTRRLYALKWSVFSAWCTTRSADPVLCDMSLI